MGLIRDAKSIARRDPAARNALEVFFLYPGYHALIYHKVARGFYKIKLKFIARWLSQLCTRRTGIEIHPGATIGRGLFIDHGAGVVIGETSEIGDNCTLYQGVTLGGTGKDTGKRHPTLGDNVMIGAGAKVLGPFRIGDNSKIAAGAVVLNEIPENSTAVGIPAKVVCRNGVRVDPVKVIEEELDHVHVPDPVEQQICDMNDRISALSAEIEALKARKRKSSKADTSAE
jgi:serine O-acetyltransferase